MEKVEIIGNLTKDPEQRATPSGQTVTNFDVAVNQRPTKAQREAGQQPPAKYFRVAAWNELGDNCAKYLAKGRKVYVEGTIRANAYIGNDGQAHASLELMANSVEFLTPRGDQGAAPDAGQGNTSPAPQNAYTAPQAAPATTAAPAGFTPVETDDLPF